MIKGKNQIFNVVVTMTSKSCNNPNQWQEGEMFKTETENFGITNTYCPKH